MKAGLDRQQIKYAEHFLPELQRYDVTIANLCVRALRVPVSLYLPTSHYLTPAPSHTHARARALLHHVYVYVCVHVRASPSALSPDPNRASSCSSSIPPQVD